MALIGISCGDTFEYVSDSDPCKRTVEVPLDPDDPGQGKRTETVIEDGATVFTLGVLDVFVMGMIYDRASSLSRGDEGGDIGITTRINQSNIEAVRYGLRGWRNFPDADGNEIPFRTVKRHTNGRVYRVVADECLERLGIRHIAAPVAEARPATKGDDDRRGTASMQSAY